MRWILFAAAAYVLLAMEVGLTTLWAIPGPTGVAPRVTLVLVAFLALRADARSAVLAAMLLGLAVDLVHPIGPAGKMTDAVIAGPAALGYGLAAYTGIQLRSIVFRDSAIALATVTFLAGIFAQLVIVAVLTARGVPWVPAAPVEGWDAPDQLVARFWELVYTAVIAIPLGWLLLSTAEVWGFPDGKKRRR